MKKHTFIKSDCLNFAPVSRFGPGYFTKTKWKIRTNTRADPKLRYNIVCYRGFFEFESGKKNNCKYSFCKNMKTHRFAHTII